MNTSTTTTPTTAWNPTSTELASILAEMRPVIDRFADRDSRLMAELMAAA